MKKLAFAFCMVMGGIVAVNAQDTTSTDRSQSNQYSTPTQDSQTSQNGDMSSQDNDRVRIQSQDLPDAVKRSLEGQEYRGWLVNGAFKSQGMSTDAATSGSSESTVGSSSTGTTGSSSTSDPNSTSSTSGNTSSSGSISSDMSGQEIYVVELKNGAQTKTVRFDKDGKKLDDQGTETSGDQK